ncbi:hypothetical protein Q8A67_024900 [Cirrhinus molitorella]|uniref:Ubiquitin-like domain-containing protein n=1 Tax=Cirrhinus molitorella TaxID=172907 RepID=A0AA88P4H6_9TELE|nr:hypothetical protein Q8A67_024900 [Cirrhinus molitorella]
MPVERLERFIPVPYDQCRLIFNGKKLKDGHTLGSYGIKDGSIIHFLINLRGGGPRPADEDEEDEDEDDEDEEDEDEDEDDEDEEDEDEDEEDEDEDEGMHRTASMEALAEMQQIEPKFSSCCMM